jgi:ribulose kinase
MLGAVACGDHPSEELAMSAMSRAARVIEPAGGEVAAYHAAKHRVFHRMYEDQMAYRAMMAT